MKQNTATIQKELNEQDNLEFVNSESLLSFDMEQVISLSFQESIKDRKSKNAVTMSKNERNMEAWIYESANFLFSNSAA